MQKRHMAAAGFATAALVFGGASAIAVANPLTGPPLPQRPTTTQTPSNGPDVPGVPDLPEPGDTPDAPAPSGH
jgi:hypothetical protein